MRIPLGNLGLRKNMSTMQQLIMFNSKTIGRDALARLIQSASNLTWNVLVKMKSDGTAAHKIKHLEYVLGNFRRLLRMGRCVDALYTALRMIQHEDTLIRLNLGMSKVGLAGFLLCDHIIWLGRNRFANVDVEWWSRFGNRFWLLSIVLNLVRDYVEIRRRLSANKELHVCKGNPRTFLKNLGEFTERHKDVVVDTIKNGCDIFVPLAALDHFKLSPITIGLLGVVSSVAQLYGVIEPMAKLPLS